jgi:hypothetical protein
MAKPRTLADLVSAGGALTTPSIVAVPGTSSGGGSVRLAEDTDNGTHYVGLRAPDAVGASLEFKLPSADGTAGQAIVTDGAGNLSFASVITPVSQAKQVIDSPVSIPSGYNAMSMDAVRIAIGGSITIPGGSKYAIKAF